MKNSVSTSMARGHAQPPPIADASKKVVGEVGRVSTSSLNRASISRSLAHRGAGAETLWRRRSAS